jgi:hypothetical protein
LKFDGLSVGGEMNLTLGYDGKFSFNTKTTTGQGTSATVYLMTSGCADSSCFDRLDVQPYWLHPVSQLAGNEAGGAPWVPTAYKSQQPWCLTWKVTCACKVGTCCPCRSACPVSAASSGISAAALPSDTALRSEVGGTALPPLNAFGRIVGGTGGGDGGEPHSHYLIQGGRLAWADESGSEYRIPMAADDFVPSKGVSIEINGTLWSFSGDRSWKRTGDTWTFRTNPGTAPSVTLSLDFGSATYDLSIQKADFNGRVLAGVTSTGLALVVNDLYKFYTVLHHDIDITWTASKPPADNLTMHVTSFQGHYNSATQSGKMSIAGTLPAQLPTFGDLEVDVNGHPYVASLISLDGFQEAYENGGVIKYAKEGGSVVVDFGHGTWSVTLNNQAFNRLVVPQLGTLRSQILVGGVPWLREDSAILDYSANLTLVH